MLPQDGRTDDVNRSKVDPDAFADQVNYLAALGRLVVPRAFAFSGRRILFVGHEPFDAEELGGLLPDATDWYEQPYAPKGFAADLVVVGRVFTKGVVRTALQTTAGRPKVIPQEAFLDELLFGHDWWDRKLDALREMVKGHPGLQAAKSAGGLHPVGIGVPQPDSTTRRAVRHRPAPSPGPQAKDPPAGPAKPASTFTWPSTEAAETRGSGDSDLDLMPESRLRQLGYTTNEPRSVRWRILTTKAVPELGLQKVASMVAWFCRSRKQQKGGRQKFARAIGEWEHDLHRLKREVYPNHRPRFTWPRSEP